VGLRLNGPVAHPESDEEIVSHGVPIGALEVPHSDELIILGRYRSLTAGYPIVAFATRASLPMLGQAGPGRELRFRWIDRFEAVRQQSQREGELRKLTRAVTESFDALGFAPAIPAAN
jgi:allophanate hydrolase subunit 2